MARIATQTKLTEPTIYTVALTTADTEYSQVLPEGTKKFRIHAMASNKNKPHKAVLRYSYTSFGNNNWAGQDYNPIPGGNYDEESELNLSGKTLYFSSPTGGGVVIIKVWK